jgi:hypothetical protein
VDGFRQKLQKFGHNRGCEHALPAARFVHACYGEQPYEEAGITLLLSREEAQPGYPPGMLRFALTASVLTVQSKCVLELNLWYADDGTLVRSVAEVAKAYQTLKDDGQKYCPLHGAPQDQPMVVDHMLCMATP